MPRTSSTGFKAREASTSCKRRHFRRRMSLLIHQRKTHFEYRSDSKNYRSGFSDNISFNGITYHQSVSRNKKLRNDKSGFQVSFFPCYVILLVILLILSIVLLIRSYRNKKKQMTALSLVFIVLLSSIFIFVVYDQSNQRAYKNPIEYRLRIHVNSTGNYSLLVPYLNNPILQNKTKISTGSGQLEFALVNNSNLTLTNSTLKVSGNDNMTIHGLAPDYSFPDMSMRDKSISFRYEYWVFCNKTNTDQNISLYIRGDSGNKHWYSAGYYTQGQSIENGWNRINMSFNRDAQ
jgi:hypothetical protein